jgi:prepilin-type N-terminal cleavage/methylation domain-containing protein
VEKAATARLLRAKRVLRPSSAFTILELLVVIAIIGVLVTLIIAGLSSIPARAQRVQCTANLHSLYVAAESYIQQNGSWPQISIADDESDAAEQNYATAWIAALRSFGPSEKNWICPTIQNQLQNPDYLKPENARIDYTATPFDDKAISPHQWPRQPWFIENGDVHGSGNLIIFTDGSVGDLNTAKTQGGQ